MNIALEQRLARWTSIGSPDPSRGHEWAPRSVTRHQDQNLSGLLSSGLEVRHHRAVARSAHGFVVYLLKREYRVQQQGDRHTARKM